MYVSARQNRKLEKIDVVERVNGKRIFTSYPVDYSFYINDENGEYKTIYGNNVSKINPKSYAEFKKELAIHSGKKIWESDLNYIFKCLSQNYSHTDSPDLHISFFDIEVAFSKEKGYSSVEDPFAEITSITLTHEWKNSLITLALRPQTYTREQADIISNKFENTFIFDDEKELLNSFLDLIEDIDLLSGWNSEMYDLPYIINRISRIMSKDDTRRLCYWNELPKEREMEKYGKLSKYYELIGRIHLDLMDVYRKFTYEERHSYSLNAISDFELKQSKTPYTGSLDTLYNQDFEKFIEYNRQDVTLLHLLDEKLKFIELLNGLAHKTTTLIPTCMGSVMMLDQAVINRAHEIGMIVNNKSNKHSDIPAVGAYVAHPKTGLHDWIGVCDINSLYPSDIRALNMGMETIVGQIRPTFTDEYISKQLEKKNATYANAWEGQFNTKEYQAVMEKDVTQELTIDWEESGKSDTLSAKDCYDLIFNSNMPWVISGNGTIFTYEKKAIIPTILGEWYAERKEMQRKMHEAVDPKEASFYKKRQHIQKILLNSEFGALLNEGSRFHDKRIGQSITLTGRTICQHMNAFINECITGEYDYKGKAIQYVDTDSSQFSAYETLKPMIDKGEINWDKEAVIKLYQSIGDKVNESFAPFMFKAFHCPEENGKIIRASCESVGYRGLYITKKRYAILNYYVDGKFLKENKLKAMGLEIKRSDCPTICQNFLEETLIDFLTHGDEQKMIEMINKFRKEFKELPFYEQGTPKRVNKLTYYTDLVKQGKGNRVPGHVRAAINWNMLKDVNKDRIHNRITDGMKTIVCPLKENNLNMTSIGYPIDEVTLPDWFKKLPFDTDSMMASVVDKKIENIFGKIPNWDYIYNATHQSTTFEDFFS